MKPLYSTNGIIMTSHAAERIARDGFSERDWEIIARIAAERALEPEDIAVIVRRECVLYVNLRDGVFEKQEIQSENN
jgi:hypothetical protein